MLLPHINYGMPILHFGGARRSGGCRYCHTAPWKRTMRRLAHGLTRSRGVTRGLARDVTWHCVHLHPIRLNRAFRSDLMWWRTFVEDWNGISFLPPLPQLQSELDIIHIYVHTCITQAINFVKSSQSTNLVLVQSLFFTHTQHTHTPMTHTHTHTQTHAQTLQSLEGCNKQKRVYWA